jgi:hypothetical protein
MQKNRKLYYKDRALSLLKIQCSTSRYMSCKLAFKMTLAAAYTCMSKEGPARKELPGCRHECPCKVKRLLVSFPE